MGDSPPAQATRYAQHRAVTPDYQGVAFVYRDCASPAASTSGPRCVIPSTVLAYRRAQGRWVVDRMDRARAQEMLLLTKLYADNWNWVWSPTLGLRVIPRVELQRPDS